ncbi:hypothetical protein [Leptothrix discophora]|uniref:Uncharacterized protein n=1 Tax=Leptothrix discophora TaxID=89 RepID=A0ABT9FYR9_LEPDI|nr:hypothetical protein [Leptothrix discophora]MDP4299295.1 hypothetical protein [Leptothrix discophora]
MAHAASRIAPLARLVPRILLVGVLGGATGAQAALDLTPEPIGPVSTATAAWRVHIGPVSRPGFELVTQLSADPGRERLYAYVDLQDRLPIPVRRVLRQADGGITVERTPVALSVPKLDGRPSARANLGSMLRWRLEGGSQMAVKLQARKVGVQVVTPLVF